MLSVVIPTQDCEQALVPTLAMLVRGVVLGAVREVIVADGGSTDGTRKVVDFAGCDMITSNASLGRRLSEAAARARGDWLLFLRPGSVLEDGWAGEVVQFAAEAIDVAEQAAVFRRTGGTLRPRSALAEVAALLRSAWAMPKADNGLLISQALYRRLGGHRDEIDPEDAFIGRIGRRRLTRLRSGITIALRPFG
jgi:glycosyltransferase involved in cell wall biosynthesis